MLPRQHRLTDDYDFRRVRRLGRPYHTSLFTLVVAPAKKKTDLRFGFVVSTKLDKRAVVRHRAVRLLREAVHKLLPQLNLGFDAVLIPKRKLLLSSYEEIGALVNQSLSKVPLLGSRLGPKGSARS